MNNLQFRNPPKNVKFGISFQKVRLSLLRETVQVRQLIFVAQFVANLGDELGGGSKWS